MRPRFALILVIGLLASATSVPAVPGGVVVAKEKDAIAEATRLRDDAKGHFAAAGDTTASNAERKKSRKEAYDRLIKARKLLDAHLDANPGDNERLDGLYCSIATMLFWVKKEMSVGELTPKKKLSGRKPKPKTEPVKPAEPATEPEPEPEVPAGPTAADVLGEIEAYGKRFPGDVPGLHERYTAFLAQFPDRSTPEYAQAVGRLEELSARLKDVYRLVRDDDPDSLKNVDDDDVVGLIDELTVDLEKGDEPVRVRAARFLGGLGSGRAAKPLIEALEREQRGEVFDACIDALAKIGGKRVCDRLQRVKPDSPLAPAVLAVLEKMVAQGGVAARIAGEALADYVRNFDEERQHEAVELLEKAGRDGALGLSIALPTAPVSRKVELIEHLGNAGDPRVAEHLAKLLTVNPQGAFRKQHKAARTAIDRLGVPCVRYLIPALEDERTNVWTGEMLRRLTGVKQKNDKRKTWERWYRKNRRKLGL